MRNKNFPQDLQKFLKEYERLANLSDFNKIEPFIDNKAVYWFSNGTYKGIKEIRKAFEETWENIKNEKYTLSQVKWIVVSETEAVCIYTFRSDGMVNGKRQVYEGRGTNVFQKKYRKWKIVHEHLSKTS